MKDMSSIQMVKAWMIPQCKGVYPIFGIRFFQEKFGKVIKHLSLTFVLSHSLSQRLEKVVVTPYLSYHLC